MWGRHKEIGTNFSRIFSLSDGVFAIVLTLLTLSIDVPKLSPDAGDLQVWKALKLDGHALVGYALSYFVVGVYWTVHHRMFLMIVRHDRRLVWRNLYFLFVLSLLPFTTSLSTGNSSSRLAWALYAANVVLIGTNIYFIWLYVCRHGHVDESVSVRKRHVFLMRSLMTPAVFMASMVVSVVDVNVARFVPLALFFLSRYGRDVDNEEEAA